MDTEKRLESLEKRVAELEKAAQPQELDINKIADNIHSSISKTFNKTE